MRRAAIGLLLGLGACTRAEVRAGFPPGASDYASAVLAVLRSGQVLSARGLSLTDSTPVVLDEVDPDAMLAMLLYRANLDEDHVPSGSLSMLANVLATSTVGRLATPDLTYVAQLHGSSLQPWSQAAEPDPLSNAHFTLLPVPAGAHCPRAQAVAIPVSSMQDDVYFLVHLDGTRALVGLASGTQLVLTGTVTSPATDTLGVSIRTGYHAVDGTIWLGGNSGELTKYSPASRTLARAATLPSTTEVRAIDGSDPGEPFELFVASNPGSFWRWDGQSFEPLSGPAMTATTVPTYPVLRLGPREALYSSISAAAAGGVADVFHFKQGVVTPTLIPASPLVYGARSLFLMKSQGAQVPVLLGSTDDPTATTHFYRLASDHTTWVDFGAGRIPGAAELSLPVFGGFLWSNSKGDVEYVDPSIPGPEGPNCALARFAPAALFYGAVVSDSGGVAVLYLGGTSGHADDTTWVYRLTLSM
jgi:hypothetical protein